MPIDLLIHDDGDDDHVRHSYCLEVVDKIVLDVFWVVWYECKFQRTCCALLGRKRRRWICWMMIGRCCCCSCCCCDGQFPSCYW